jgi:hypothetical protein
MSYPYRLMDALFSWVAAPWNNAITCQPFENKIFEEVIFLLKYNQNYHVLKRRSIEKKREKVLKREREKEKERKRKKRKKKKSCKSLFK